MNKLYYTYHPGASMGHPAMNSIADIAEHSAGATAVAVAIEQVAYEARTANLIQYLRDNAARDPLYGQVMREIRTRLGLAPGDWEKDHAEAE